MQKNIIMAGSILLTTLLLTNGCSEGSTVERAGDLRSNLPVNGGQNQGNVGDINKTIQEDEPTVSIGDDSNTTQSQEGNTTQDENSTISAANNIYKIDLIPENKTVTSNQVSQINYVIKEMLSGEAAGDSVVTKLIFSVDPDYAEFIQPEDGSHGSTYTINNPQSTGMIALTSKGNSGQIKIDVKATINGVTDELTKYLPVIIIKNKSSSMATVPTSIVTYDANLGLYIERYSLHVVDKYGNKAKDGTHASVGLVNRFKYSSNGQPLYARKLTNANDNVGKIEYTNENSLFSLNGGTLDFQNVDTKDTLVILADQDKSNPQFMGGWSIKSINHNTNVLTLWEHYTGATDQGLSYVVGDDKRTNSCDATLANAAIYAPEGYEVKDGIVKLEVRYGPYMIGKTGFFYANSKLDEQRIGVSRKITFKGTGIVTTTNTCDNSDNNETSLTCSWTNYLRFKDSGEFVKDVEVTKLCKSGPCVNTPRAPGTQYIKCNGAIEEDVIAPPKKNVSVTRSYLIVHEL